MPDPQEGKQGRHRKGCLCTTHMAKQGVQPVVQPIATVEVSPMTTPMTFEQFQAEQAAYQQYLATQTAAPVAPVAPMPITQTPVAPTVIPAAPVVAAPVVAAPVVATVVPTPEYVIPLTELSTERPKKGGFFRYIATADVGGKSDFDHKTNPARLQKIYISPLWSAGRENNLEIVIRERTS